MYTTMDAASPFASLYFIAVAVLGGFFVVNLFLAVILTEFLAAQVQELAWNLP